MMKDDSQLLRYGWPTALLISVVLEPIDIPNRHFPRDATTGMADEILPTLWGASVVLAAKTGECIEEARIAELPESCGLEGWSDNRLRESRAGLVRFPFFVSRACFLSKRKNKL